MIRHFAVCTLLILLLSATSFADELPKKVTIATWNLEWFFDNYTSDNSFDVPKKQSPPNMASNMTVCISSQYRPCVIC